MSYIDGLNVHIDKCPLEGCAFNGVILDGVSDPDNSKVFWCQHDHVLIFHKDAWKEVWDFTKPEWLR